MTLGFHRQLVGGFLAPTRGFVLILSNSRIRKWAAIPFLIAILVFTLGLTLGIPTFIGLLPTLALQAAQAIASSAAVASFTYWTVLILAWPVAIAALLYALLIVTKIVAAPFASFLAECVLSEFGAMPQSRFHLGNWLGANARMILVSIFRSLLFALVGLVLFVVSFVPGLGLLTFFCFLLMASFDVSDAAFEALQMGLSERFRFFRQHLPAFCGLAVAMGLVFLIPGLNFFLFPAAVAGATDMVRRLRENQNVRPLPNA